MTLRISNSYREGSFRVDGEEIPVAVMKAAYVLKEGMNMVLSLALLKAHKLEEDEAKQLLLALDDANMGDLRNYTVEDGRFADIFKEAKPKPEPEPSEPKITVVLRGGIVQYVTYGGDSKPPKADVIDLDDHEPMWSQEDIEQVELQTRIW